MTHVRWMVIGTMALLGAGKAWSQGSTHSPRVIPSGILPAGSLTPDLQIPNQSNCPGLELDIPCQMNKDVAHLLHLWNFYWRTGNFGSAQFMAQRACHLAPANLQARHALVVSQVVNASRPENQTPPKKNSIEVSVKIQMADSSWTHCLLNTLSSVLTQAVLKSECVPSATKVHTSPTKACCQDGIGCHEVTRGCCTECPFLNQNKTGTVSAQKVEVELSNDGKDRLVQMPWRISIPTMPMSGANPTGSGMVPPPIPPAPVSGPVREMRIFPPRVAPVSYVLVQEVARSARLQFNNADLNIQCHRMKRLADGRMVFEGEVCLTMQRDQNPSKIMAERIVLDLATGAFEVKPGGIVDE